MTASTTAQRAPYFDVSEAAQVAEAYMDSIDPIFTVRAREIGPQGLDLGLEAYHAGAMLIGRAHMRGAHYEYQRDRTKIAQTGLDMIMVQIITGGDDIRFHGEEALETRPGDVCIDDLTRPFATRTCDCDNISIVLPRATLGLDALQLDRIHGLTFKRESLAASLISVQATALLGQFDRCSPEEAAAAAHATGLMIGGLAEPMANRSEADEAIAVAVLQRVQRYIQANLARADLTPGGVARAVGMSRATLYRIFAPFGGVQGYIRQQRLLRVMADLRNTRLRAKSIAEIAYGWGFNDWSAFSRAFKLAFDMTPSSARATVGLLRSAQAGAQQLLLPHWLRQMEEGDIRMAAAYGANLRE